MVNKAVFDISLKNKLNSFYTNIKLKLWKKMHFHGHSPVTLIKM